MIKKDEIKRIENGPLPITTGVITFSPEMREQKRNLYSEIKEGFDYLKEQRLTTMSLKVYKVRDNAKLPARAYPNDAGADVFYCPEDENKEITLKPGKTTVLQTGIKVGIPKGYMLEVKNKSGIAAKKQLLVGSCVCDSGYSGEILINLHNVGDKTTTIEPGQKIAQIVLVPVISCQFEEISDEEKLYESNVGEETKEGHGINLKGSNGGQKDPKGRGEGGFGSTGE